MRLLREFGSDPRVRRALNWSVVLAVCVGVLGGLALKVRAGNGAVGIALLVIAMLIVASTMLVAFILWLTGRETAGIRRLATLFYPATPVIAAGYAYATTAKYNRFFVEDATFKAAVTCLLLFLAFLPIVYIVRGIVAVIRWVKDGFTQAT